jgi:uncharacterized protein
MHEAAIVLALTALVTIVPLLPPGAAAALGGGAALALTAMAWIRRAPWASSLGVLFVTCLVLAGAGPQQVVFALAFVVYAAIASSVPWFHEAVSVLAPGRWDGRSLALGAAFAAISGLTLLAWYVVARPDLADLVRTFVPDWPLWLLVPAAVAFSIVNAAVEEAAYRGVLLGALERAGIPAQIALILQACAFAALHFRAGFPRGPAGVGLTFVYGLVLGVFRHRTGGLLVPFVTHVLTDLTIVAIVLALVHR